MSSNIKSRLILVGMFIFFVVPILVVTLMYKYDWHPNSFSYGELIKPIIKINVPNHIEIPLKKNQDSSERKLFHERWSFVYLTDKCNTICDNRLHDLRQIHASFDKDIPRIQRVLITYDKNTDRIQDKYPDLIILNKPIESVANLSSQFNTPQYKAVNSDNVYIVDPMSNVMMLYTNKIKPIEIRKDISRLLKSAWAG
jgi:cytochrome oxidase Cu insertion factor (SCO1/SenC/PrrC family)